MQGATFITSIQSASTQNLKQAYVLMTKTSMTKMISSKFLETTDFIQRKKKFDHYQHFIDKEVELVDYTREELPFEVIAVFAKRYDISLSSIDTQQGLHEFGDLILNKAVQSYRSMNKKFTGTTFEDVVHHFFKKMFEEIGKKYKEGSEEEKEELEKAFESFIADLPEHQKEKLKKELNVSELSQQMINRILATNGTVVLFSALVNTMGFSFYMGATSLLASGASLLGLTLPFAAYTSMTSLIAVLANPLFFLGVIAVSGLYFTKQRTKMTEMMCFLAVMQLFFSQDGKEETSSFDDIKQKWQSKYSHYQYLVQEIKEIATEKAKTTNLIDRYSENKSTFEEKVANVKKSIAQQHVNISNDLQTMRLEKLAEHEMLVTIVHQLQDIERDIDFKSKKIIGGQGVIEKMKASVLNSKNAVVVKERERKRKKLYSDMANLIVRKDVPLFDVESKLISDLKDRNIENQRKLNDMIDKIQHLKEQRKQLTKRYPLLENERKEMLKKYPGIDKVIHRVEDKHVLYS
ncbi:hypothetical protein [Salipaludibacillus daqingensis]|uniref:hypothetical protein n=1 Tax=Salipaludibacillus daqingensis TaxID=3041001 RepID=UPI002473AE34|nr:hypothetical protein [Salipaludibacillus daqingensis]